MNQIRRSTISTPTTAPGSRYRCDRTRLRLLRHFRRQRMEIKAHCGSCQSRRRKKSVSVVILRSWLCRCRVGSARGKTTSPRLWSASFWYGASSPIAIVSPSGIHAYKLAGVFVVAQPNPQLMLDFVTAMVSRRSDTNESTQLIRTCQMKFTPDQAKVLFIMDNGQLCVQVGSIFPSNAVIGDRTRPRGSHVYVYNPQKAAEATAGSVVMEYQGRECYNSAMRRLEEETFGALARSNAICLSRDDADARYDGHDEMTGCIS